MAPKENENAKPTESKRSGQEDYPFSRQQPVPPIHGRGINALRTILYYSRNGGRSRAPAPTKLTRTRIAGRRPDKKPCCGSQE
eukprot:IDg5635t1